MHSLGPYFDVDRHDLGASPSGPWRSMAELLDADVLSGRVEQIRGALAQAGQREADDVPLRVAASVMQLGLVARLVSPVLAETALTGRQVSVGLADWWWQSQVAGTFPMSIPAAPDLGADDGESGDPEPLAAMAGRKMLDGSVARLTAIIGDRFGLSTRVLWGNVASVLNAARGLIIAAEPAAAGRIDLIVAHIRQRPELAQETCAFGPDFRRHSCCLIYQLVPDRADAVCGDCVLRTPRDAEPV